MRYKKIQISLFLIVMTALLTTAGCYRKTTEQRAQGMVDSIVAKLNLNDVQKAKLNAIKTEFLAKTPAMKKTREESFDQMIALMRSPSIDPASIKALQEKNRAQADDLIGFIFDKFAEFHDMLTPEQRDKAAKEMEHWREQYREYNKGGK